MSRVTASGRQMRRIVFPILSVLPLISTAPAESATSPPPSRDIYDRYVAASVFETQAALCEQLAPETYRAFQPQIVSWREENRALIQRLDIPAHQWALPGDWKLDDVLRGIIASVTGEAIKRTQNAQSDQCARLLQQLASTFHR